MAVLAVLAGLSGFLIGGTSPASLELAAQLTYPVPEGLTANLITNLLTQSFTIVFLSLLQGVLPDSASTAVVGCGCGFCFLSLLPAREHYRRLDAERARLALLEGGHTHASVPSLGAAVGSAADTASAPLLHCSS